MLLPHFELDFPGFLRFNTRNMKTLATLTLAALAALALSSCGECNCKDYNPDYLRDVPVSRSQRFQ